MELTPLVRDRPKFASQVIKSLIGERTIDTFAQLKSKDRPPDSGFLGALFGNGLKIVGFLVKAAFGLLSWSWSALWGTLVEVYYEIKNFDWAQTDASLVSEMQQSVNTLAAALGQLTGTAIAWLGTIGLIGVASIQFPVISAYVALRVAEEAGDELRGKLLNLVSVTRNVGIRALLLSSLLTARKIKLFGLTPVTKTQKPWTLANRVDEFVKKTIPNETIRTFVENALESFEEGVIEAGYVVSFAVDDFYEMNRQANQNQFGNEKLIEIIPDTRVPEETLVLAGKSELIKPTIQGLINTHKMIENRDVGQIVGQPVDDYLKAKPQLRKLTIRFQGKEKPPFKDENGNRVKQITYQIPDARQGLTWAEIKTAAKFWTWGKYRCTANLSNGRQMAVYGATPGEAESKLRELKTLTTAEILTLSVTEEKDRNLKLKKEATVMYPCDATLLVRRTTVSDPTHVALSGQGYSEERKRFKLYLDTAPDDYDPMM